MRSLSRRRASGSKPGCPVRRVAALEVQHMAMYQLNVDGQRRTAPTDPSTPLLWVLREDLKMTGTKYGCGISACGACTVLVGGVATRSCAVPISLLGDR